MNVVHVVGVDNGLIHNGLVRLIFVPDKREIQVTHTVVDGPDAVSKPKTEDILHLLNEWVHWVDAPWGAPVVFVEGYRTRSNFNTDARMMQLVQDTRRTLAAKVLSNTGVKTVVKHDLMELLGVWKFSTVTHHQDLRSAARIALLGMLKDAAMNRLLTDIVRAHLNGEDWTVLA